jgi:hypothetical protein
MAGLLKFFVACICIPTLNAESDGFVPLPIGGNNDHSVPCTHLTHDGASVARSASEARNLIEKRTMKGNIAGAVPFSDRLAIMLLASETTQLKTNTSTSQQQYSLHFLRCALKKLKENLLSKTPADVFFWVRESHLHKLPKWINAENYPFLYIMTIYENTWRVPCGLSNYTDWVVHRKFSMGYYIMGRWRLTFGPDFVRALGYKYWLQYDDDAVVTKEIPYNIVSEMHRHEYKMGVFPKIETEVSSRMLYLFSLALLAIACYHGVASVIVTFLNDDVTKIYDSYL